jgi:hypothetical protein
MRTFLAFISLIFLLFFASPSNSACGFKEPALYDSFSNDSIDGKKWRQREFVREIVNGKFVSKLGNRSPGMDAEIEPGIFRNHLPFEDPDSIHAIACEMTMENAVPDSAAGSRSGAMILGYFYNINSSGGATGDIFVYLMIGKRKESSDLEALWAVFQVMSDDTANKNLLGSGIIDGFDPAEMAQPYVTKIVYDNDRTFQFSVGAHTHTYVGPEKKRGPVTKLKSLSTGIDAVNGANNGYVSAKFDNVVINNGPSDYDDFSASRIDLSKWRASEWIREAKNGYLRAEIPGYDATKTVNTHLEERDAPYVEAKVLINSGTELSSGANCVARIQGYYYNERRGPGSSQPYNRYEGDVFVQVRLYYDSKGTISADAFVHRSEDENESSYTELFSHNFSNSIALDTYYTLSICYKGNKLVFGFNGETAEYTILSPMYPAYGEHRLLRSRLYLDSGESGYVKARFDDVFILKKGQPMPWVPLLLLTE